METTIGIGFAMAWAVVLVTLFIVCHNMNFHTDREKKLLHLFVSLVLYVPVVLFVYYSIFVYMIWHGISNPESPIALAEIGMGLFYVVLFSIIPLLALREIRKTLREGEEEQIAPPQQDNLEP